MYVKFKELKYKNINSYGNKETIFSLSKGLNSISGTNGQGKSTILDALCFCLFGKPFRKVKIGELINRVNKKNLTTEVTFNINNDVYKIIRTLKPDSLTITKNGSNLDLLSSKALNQDEIDSVLGIDITIFRQVISLAINYNKPFLALKTAEKRDIIETIFNIKIFGTMVKRIKSENTGIKTEQQINNKAYTLIKKNAVEISEDLKKYIEKEKTFEEDKNKQLKTIDKKITENEQSLAILNNDINDYNKKIHNSKVELFEDTKRSGSVSHIISSHKKDVAFFENNENCKICKTEMSEQHRNEHIKELKKEIKKLEKEMVILSDEIKYKKKIKDSEQKIEFITEQLKEYNDNRTYTEKQKFSINIAELQQKLEEKKEEYKLTWEKLQETGKEIKRNDIVIKMLGDEGIKTYFFAKLIPILNQKVNEFLDLFDLPITITFDEYMNECINTLKDKNVSYWSFSEGEKKRIDIAILLSFIETTKLISNWGCNLIIFDELLDTSTDSDGIDKIFDAIKEMLFHDTELCTYIISHRDLDVNFDGKYSIRKINGFSQILFESKV